MQDYDFSVIAVLWGYNFIAFVAMNKYFIICNYCSFFSVIFLSWIIWEKIETPYKNPFCSFVIPYKHFWMVTVFTFIIMKKFVFLFYNLSRFSVVTVIAFWFESFRLFMPISIVIFTFLSSAFSIKWLILPQNIIIYPRAMYDNVAFSIYKDMLK